MPAATFTPGGGEEILLTPGPVTVHPDVLAALAEPVRLHYGEQWADLYGRTRAGLARIFRSEGHVLLVFGPGMAGLEMAIGSLLAPGEEILVPATGRFAARLADVARALGLATGELAVPELEPLAPEALERELAVRPGTRAVALVHHETGLGMLNPLRELCAVARAHGALVIVDAVSSLGGVELAMDDWGIDACVGVANKCLGAPIGVAPVALSRRALAVVEDGRPKAVGWYLDAARWLENERARPQHPHPTTMPTNVVRALSVAVERVLEQGVEPFVARHAEAAARTRAELAALGFRPVVEGAAASPVTTAIWAGERLDVADYVGWLARERGLRIAPGLDELAGSMFRIGHMGRACEPAVVEAYLAATADYLAAGAA